MVMCWAWTSLSPLYSQMCVYPTALLAPQQHPAVPPTRGEYTAFRVSATIQPSICFHNSSLYYSYCFVAFIMSFSDFSYPGNRQDQDQTGSINPILWKMKSKALDIIQEPSHLVKVFAYISLLVTYSGKRSFNYVFWTSISSLLMQG